MENIRPEFEDTRAATVRVDLEDVLSVEGVDLAGFPVLLDAFRRPPPGLSGLLAQLRSGNPANGTMQTGEVNIDPELTVGENAVGFLERHSDGLKRVGGAVVVIAAVGAGLLIRRRRH